LPTSGLKFLTSVVVAMVSVDVFPAPPLVFELDDVGALGAHAAVRATPAAAAALSRIR
jgi:hypothetical protein